jgi:hypothetical protein
VSTSGLDHCACKRGFFTLRDCDNAATTTCSLCSRRVCDEHLAPRIDTKVCVECAARQEEAGTAGPYAAAGAAGTQPGGPTASGQPGLGPPLEQLDPTDSAVRWRTRYYRDRGYSPVWWGTYDPYWDNWGYRWYDDNDDDDDRGGFGDS